jgi:hypothetical protein
MRQHATSADVRAAYLRRYARTRASRVKRPLVDAHSLRVVGYLDRWGNPQPSRREYES